MNAQPQRSTERHLLLPSVDASFGSIGVSINDISLSGVRVKHDMPLEAGSKSVLRFRTEERPTVAFEAVVVWTQPVIAPEESGQFVSGVKLFADRSFVGSVIDEFGERRSAKVEEKRLSDRFHLTRPISAEFGAYGFVKVGDLSSKGLRVETSRRLTPGARGNLRFSLPDGSFEVNVEADVVWSQLKSIWSSDENRYSNGLQVLQRHEFLRLAVGQLRELNLALPDTRSLRLKVRLGPFKRMLEQLGRDPDDQGALIAAIRDEMKNNPDGAIKWNQRAQELLTDPSIRGLAGPISSSIEAIAIWEFFDRTIDPTLIAKKLGMS